MIGTEENIILTGTAQAGAAQSITLAAGANATPDFYVRPGSTSVVSLVSGTGAGQQRNVVTSRQNLAVYSQSFDNAIWSAFGTKTVTANAAIAPDGTMTAELLSSPAGNGVQQQGMPIVGGSTYTGSLHVKNTTGTQIRLQLVSSGGAGVTYNQLVTVGSGWVRIPFSLTTASGDSMIQARILTDASGNPVYIWGFHLELGSIATEYIHTEATAAVGVATDTPWTTVPDSTSVYEIIDDIVYNAELPGSEIGEFAIGINQIGDDPSFDFTETVISQYANSPILYQLIENLNAYLDQTGNISNLFDMMFNVDTAQGFGLDIIGRIVGVTRVLPISSGTYFGFEEAGASGFNQDPLYGGSSLTNNVALSDEAFRLLLLMKAYANICDNSIPAINQLLLQLFPGRGVCYVADNENMSMTYHFLFTLTPVEVSIITNSGVLPRMSGCAVNYVYP